MSFVLVRWQKGGARDADPYKENKKKTLETIYMLLKW